MQGFGNLQPVSGPFDGFRADIIDATNVPGIDEQTHGLNCSCGCRGNARVISEPSREGAYIASTVTEESLGIDIEG